ncbi:MAG: PqqD family protein [Rubricoccaceae bacterium]|nr:PqqD family protein [Rubricoccaceae bacterium]
MVTEDTVVVAAEGLSVAELDGEAVILSPHTSAYFGLNDVGARAFALAHQPRRLREIIETMHEEFDADRETLAEDLVRFFAQLVEAELIETHGDDAS